MLNQLANHLGDGFGLGTLWGGQAVALFRQYASVQVDGGAFDASTTDVYAKNFHALYLL
jgi:hypothetical protein